MASQITDNSAVCSSVLFKYVANVTTKKTPKLHITGPLWVKSTRGFRLQTASNVEKLDIWWRHHALYCVFVSGELLYNLTHFSIEQDITKNKF